MLTTDKILNSEWELVVRDYPYVAGFFENHNICPSAPKLPLGKYIESLSDEFFEDIGISKMRLVENLGSFIKNMPKASTNAFAVNSISIIGGFDKSRVAENIQLDLFAGTITSIVGPTGSGKSRLLADIEWMAQDDTPTGRTILVNNEIPDTELRFSLEHKLVAQLSQNMNFVMDTTVEDFINMHAESRMVPNVDTVTAEIIAQANLLAGEKFTGQTPVTSLSGGQSRALMIADTAFLSTSPVVLIDEIENAGIDRKKALQLLVKNEKIVLMATHDPILALMADKRLVIKNGGIHKVIQTSIAEKQNLAALEALDNKIQTLRNRLRNGELISNIEI